MPANPLEGMLTARQVADMLGYQHPSAIARLVEQGKLIEAFRADGKTGARYFRRRDVERFARQRAVADRKAAS